MNTTEIRGRIGLYIISSEIRRDRQGNITVYKLPAGDGGGTYEVAGINERYHPQEAAKLKRMIEQGRYDEAEREVGDYIIQYTDEVRKWLPEDFSPATEMILRDTCFNAGPGGAARVLQMAFDLTVDGIVGSKSKTAIAGNLKENEDADTALRIHGARWEYMHGKSQNPGKAQFWKGWRNRMSRCIQDALSITISY